MLEVLLDHMYSIIIKKYVSSAQHITHTYSTREHKQHESLSRMLLSEDTAELVLGLHKVIREASARCLTPSDPVSL